MCVYIVIGILVLYVSYLVVVAVKVTAKAMYPHGNTYKHEIEILKGFGYDCNTFLDKYTAKEFTVKSNYGYDLHGRIFKQEKSNKAVVLCHGYGGNSTTMLSYADIFMDLGFSVAVYDHRNFGINEKNFTSFGYYESKDLVKVFDYVKTMFPKETQWGLMGESMGAATMLMALPEIKGLCFAVDDCGYSDMKTIIKMKNPLPSLGSETFCSMLMKIKFGFFMKDVRPYLSIKKADYDLPMLFVYSKTDKTVPFSMFDKIYANKEGKKDCWIIDDCRHAKAIFFYNEEYRKRLESFLIKYGILG